MRYFHTAIAVVDLQVSRTFYEAVFGLKFKAEGERPESKYKFVILEDKDHNAIELFKHESPLPLNNDLMNFQNVGIKHIAFVVDDLETTINNALAYGAKIIQPINKGLTVKRKAFISDPNGIPIELAEL